VENKNNTYDLITKKLTSSISEEEKALLHQVLSENTEIAENTEILQKYWDHYFFKSYPNNILSKTEKKLGFKLDQNKNFSLKTVYSIAATILLILSLGFIGFQLTRQKPEVVLTNYYANNSIKNIVLSDGTKVWLNKGTVLITSQPFTENLREVLLVGEGYFEVASDETKPFIVKTAHLSTRVLGTHFNMASYPGTKNTEVTLYEGKVELTDAGASNNNITLKPGERATFSLNDKNFFVKDVDISKPAAWRNGCIYFYDEDLFAIAQKLEFKFQTQIIITDEEVGKLRFTADFDKETLEEILKLLSEAHAFDYTKTQDGIIINKIKQQYKETTKRKRT
jgi:ferric-dicitrate binding protein FerR (iron transport regulator)